MKIITKRNLIIAAITGTAIAILDALFLEKYFFEIKTFEVGKKGADQKLKLLFLTDLHFKKFLDPSYKKLARKINESNPDLILISGDVIDEGGIYAPAKQFFSLLRYSIPKVAIMGNHDHKNRIKIGTYKKLYAQNNCDLLLNESKVFTIAGKRLMVTGVDDFINGTPSFSKAIRDVGREENHILLIHSPLQQETILKEMQEINLARLEENKLNIQYIFAGHNHGGQLCIFGLAPIQPEMAGKYLKGWYNQEAPFLYLSRGFGTTTLPFRFGARSEMTVFYLGV
ncbi:metallophosphoesterase [Segetibacter sp.]|jgi:predicted MPP superfamily phosphohydrolase|uniref:metallophosphoesterase n=1 Tax=Segetibacter sp. TaxID=2231182 RepID=UPI00262F76E8|nr:metallophosphoesterase [Segetibacter sp.]MCW3081204.1 metallophosphoesterase [Segetibacter sp.]